MADVKYTKDHEWIRVEGDVGTVGITDYAQEQLGDVVFVELPAGRPQGRQGRGLAVVESVKAASDVYAPVSGEVVEVNAALADTPGDVNAEPRARAGSSSSSSPTRASSTGLMDEAAYDDFVKSLG